MSPESLKTSATPRRPMSPHLQVWSWHVTMAASILNRATGIASVVGAVAVAGWLICLALGPDTYTIFLTYAKSPLGLLVWFGLSLAGFVHLMGGLRHFVWDMGAGLQPRTASALALWSMIIGVLLTIAFWAWLFVSGKVVL
ncbi:succinate dehydrogenase, cytochrome b556 subunit [Asticcacaulis solisilvae]|uniref:succinate dehydrogenase, cytochrome b556 subunit n=1 Tax=Asticcacaulis solisilvae TaxID=1217274 RepID=UPI003FD7B451